MDMSKISDLICVMLVTLITCCDSNPYKCESCTHENEPAVRGGGMSGGMQPGLVSPGPAANALGRGSLPQGGGGELQLRKQQMTPSAVASGCAAKDCAKNIDTLLKWHGRTAPAVMPYGH